MRMTVLAYYDIQTQKFNPAFFVPFSLDDSIESITDAVKKGQLDGAQFFELYHLGSYDTENALFNLNEKPAFVVKLADYVRKEN